MNSDLGGREALLKYKMQRATLNLFKSLENKGCIDPTKGEVIADDIVAVECSRFAANVIKLAASRIHLFQVQGGREPIVVHHFKA